LAVTGGQEDTHGGTHAGFAIDECVTAVVVHYAVYRRQSHARSFADILGRKKRFEDARDDIRVYSGTGIGHRKFDEMPVDRLMAGRAHYAAADMFAQRHVHAAGAVHRVARIDAEVYQNLFEMDRIDLNRGQHQRKLPGHFDRRGQ
jgi:hypothetical protein